MLAILGHILTTAGARWPGAVDLSVRHTPRSLLVSRPLVPSFCWRHQIGLHWSDFELGFSKCQDDVAAFCEARWMSRAGMRPRRTQARH
ncbi:unnamed protein product [Heterosigma akashiwo]